MLEDLQALKVPVEDLENLLVVGDPIAAQSNLEKNNSEERLTHERSVFTPVRAELAEPNRLRFSFMFCFGTVV